MLNKLVTQIHRSILNWYYLPQTYLVIVVISFLVTIPLSDMLAGIAGVNNDAEGIVATIGYPVLLGLIVFVNLLFSLTVFILHFYIRITLRTKRLLFNLAVLLWLASMFLLGLKNYNLLVGN